MRPSNPVILNSADFRATSLDYLGYLETLGYRSHTTICRYQQVMKFLEWSEQQGIGKVQQITTKHLNEYKEHLTKQPNANTGGSQNPKTIYDKLRAVELFLMMLQHQQRILTNPFSRFRNSYEPSGYSRSILTQSEIHLLYKATIDDRERALLSLAYGCGLRASELEAVNVSDIRFRESILIVPRGKGNKRRTIPLSKQVKEDLKHYYYDQRSNPAQMAFMLNVQGHRLRTYSANRLLQKIMGRTAICKSVSLHSLRHSIATHLLENGIAVEQVRLFLGHSELETTETYTRVNQEQLQKLIE